MSAKVSMLGPQNVKSAYGQATTAPAGIGSPSLRARRSRARARPAPAEPPKSRVRSGIGAAVEQRAVRARRVVEGCRIRVAGREPVLDAVRVAARGARVVPGRASLEVHAARDEATTMEIEQRSVRATGIGISQCEPGRRDPVEVGLFLSQRAAVAGSATGEAPRTRSEELEVIDTGEGSGAERPDEQLEAPGPRRECWAAADTADSRPDCAANRGGEYPNLEEPSPCRVRGWRRRLCGCGPLGRHRPPPDRCAASTGSVIHRRGPPRSGRSRGGFRPRPRGGLAKSRDLARRCRR